MEVIFYTDLKVWNPSLNSEHQSKAKSPNPPATVLFPKSEERIQSPTLSVVRNVYAGNRSSRVSTFLPSSTLYLSSHNLQSLTIVIVFPFSSQRNQNRASILQRKLLTPNVPDTAERVPGFSQHCRQHWNLRCGYQ